MKIWKHTWLDSILFMLCIAQFMIMLFFASYWDNLSSLQAIGSFVILTLMITYNIIVISHLFTHAAWFCYPFLNGMVSLLNTVNIGQSVFSYHLYHVRNHHRYNNDRKGLDGNAKDLSSTYQGGIGDDHVCLFQYACVGAFNTLINTFYNIFSVCKLWRIGKKENALLENILAKSLSRRIKEIQQIRLERMFHFVGICLFISISWKWTILCYFPAFYLALTLVNIQNYYEHFGATPESKFANSISYYGKLYNLLSFNDGYHQEHHLRPGEHWSVMPKIRFEYQHQLDNSNRVISPVPAILGFLDRKRKLHNNNLPVEQII